MPRPRNAIEIFGLTRGEGKIVGEEVVSGHKTTKYQIIATNKRGDRAEGLIWLTKEAIPIKLDYSVPEKGTGKTHHTYISSELRNLRNGRQDPKLFEIPAGYRKIEMGGFGPGGGMDMPIPKDITGR